MVKVEYKDGQFEIIYEEINRKDIITRKQVCDLLVGAFEGGSNYWASIIEKVLPTKRDFDSWEMSFKEKLSKPYMVDYILNEGGVLVIEDNTFDKPKTYKITIKDVIDGLKIFITKHNRYYEDWRKENDDAITSDVFFQCIVLKECIYG